MIWLVSQKGNYLIIFYPSTQLFYNKLYIFNISTKSEMMIREKSNFIYQIRYGATILIKYVLNVYEDYLVLFMYYNEN